MMSTARSFVVPTRLLAAILAILALMIASLVSPDNIRAQSVPGVTTSFYGYFSPDSSTLLTLGQLESVDPSLAAEMVSPRYADDFFSSFANFTDYDFAADLKPGYIDQIDEADEYMVFKGMLDSVGGIKPGYVIFLSSAQQVFILIAYQTDAEDLFSLAELTIQEGAAPRTYADFNRTELSNDASETSQSSSDTSTADGDEFCYIEPTCEVFDANSDGVLTISELEDWVELVPDIQVLLNQMRTSGFDQVRYTGC